MIRHLRAPLVVTVVAALSLGFAPADRSVVESAIPLSSDNMTHVGNVQYPTHKRDPLSITNGVGGRIDMQGGTDLEMIDVVIPDVAGLPEGVTAGETRSFAFAGTYNNGLQVVDITDPENPVLATTYDCDTYQGDIQVWQRDEAGVTRTYVTFTDDANGKPSQCYADAGTGPKRGTVIIDATNPYAPKGITFISIPRGSHNQTLHPSGNYLYNSNSDSTGSGVEIHDIRDIRNPILVKTQSTGGGSESHDITFNAAGTRAYVAAKDHTVIFNTTDPANPSIVGRIDDDAITLHHQADPLTLGNRTFVLINDELNGAGGNEYCPGGGVHVWEVTDESAPVKVGAFFIPDVTVRQGAPTGLASTVSCTSHVFRIYPEQGLMTIAWMGGGVRVLDVTALEGYSVGVQPLVGSLTPGIQEIGFSRFDDSDVWAAKVHTFDEDGSFYLFGNDQTRGFDVFHYDATVGASENAGEWLNPTDALARTQALREAGHIAHHDDQH